MDCIITPTPVDPQCEMKGAAGKSVTLKVVGTKGIAKFESVLYDGQPVVPANDELTFTIKAGKKNLTIVYAFSDPDGTAELHEKCDQNTLLDDDINTVNNGKLYRVCGSAAAAAGGDAVAVGAAPKKEA